MKNEEPIYLDEEGYQAFLQEIQRLKEAINQNNLGRSAAFDAGSGDGWDSPEFEEIERVDLRLRGELQRKNEQLGRIVIVEKHNNPDVVDIGDTVLIDLIFAPGDSEELTIKLVASSEGYGEEEVSINSPLGSAIYKKSIGDTCVYVVNGNTLTAFLKKKLNLTNEDGPTKRLEI